MKIAILGGRSAGKPPVSSVFQPWLGGVRRAGNRWYARRPVFCGDGKEYLPAMKALIAEIDLRPVFIGGLEYSPIIDSLARLYFALALGQNHWRHLGFKMLKTGPDHL